VIGDWRTEGGDSRGTSAVWKSILTMLRWVRISWRQAPRLSPFRGEASADSDEIVRNLTFLLKKTVEKSFSTAWRGKTSPWASVRLADWNDCHYYLSELSTKAKNRTKIIRFVRLSLWLLFFCPGLVYDGYYPFLSALMSIIKFPVSLAWLN
jgi:hypothetical protein